MRNANQCGMQTVFTTQRPHLVNGSITNETTELVSFRLQEESALKRMEFLGLSAAEASGLPGFRASARNVPSRQPGQRRNALREGILEPRVDRVHPPEVARVPSHNGQAARLGDGFDEGIKK